MNKFLKSFFNVLFAPLIWLIQACSPLGKPVDMEISDNFYYSKDDSDVIYSSMGNWFELGKSPLNAHAESFQVLNRHIGKDKNNAYYREHPVSDPDLDLESFRASREEWMSHIGMDKYRVYSFTHDVIDGKWQLITKIVEGADPETFKQYDYYWSKDSSQHFYNFQSIPVDYASFEIVNETFAKDEKSIFLHYQGRFEKIEGVSESFEKIDRYYAKDESNVFLFVSYLRGEKIESMRFIPYTNAASIQVLEQYFLLADDLVYYQGMQLPNAKASTIKVLDELYAKDEQHVYYMNQIIEGADAATFTFDKNYVIYKDKNNRYRDGKIWNGKDQTVGNPQQSSMINSTPQEENAFEVTISTSKNSYEKGEDIELQMTVKNIGNQTDRFCDYHTPFEGIQNNIFTVLCGKKDIPYQGMMKKRIPPSEKNYKTLPAGKSSECSVVLSGYDLSEKGTYAILFAGNLISGLPASNTIEFKIN